MRTHRSAATGNSPLADLKAFRSNIMRAIIVGLLIVALLATGQVGATGAPEVPGSSASGSWSSHDAPRGSNWVVVKATSTRPVTITSPFRVVGRRTGTGPLVIGYGLSVQGGPNPFAWTHVSRVGGGRPEIAVGGAVDERLPLFTVFDEEKRFGVEPVHVEQRAKVIAVFVFAVNGVIESVDWKPAAHGVRVRSSVRWGRGATALMVGQPATGITAAAPGAGSGLAEFERSPKAGIVGAAEYVSCQACAGSWRPPNGETRLWYHVRNQAAPACWCFPAVGDNTSFAGPAGKWKWTWSGVSASDPTLALNSGPASVTGAPVVAAYAPIGADWKLFRPCPHLQGCLASDLLDSAGTRSAGRDSRPDGGSLSATDSTSVQPIINHVVHAESFGTSAGLTLVPQRTGPWLPHGRVVP